MFPFFQDNILPFKNFFPPSYPILLQRLIIQLPPSKLAPPSFPFPLGATVLLRGSISTFPSPIFLYLSSFSVRCLGLGYIHTFMLVPLSRSPRFRASSGSWPQFFCFPQTFISFFSSTLCFFLSSSSFVFFPPPFFSLTYSVRDFFRSSTSVLSNPWSGTPCSGLLPHLASSPRVFFRHASLFVVIFPAPELDRRTLALLSLRPLPRTLHSSASINDELK